MTKFINFIRTIEVIEQWWATLTTTLLTITIVNIIDNDGHLLGHIVGKKEHWTKWQWRALTLTVIMDIKPYC